ncbi:hypothetical protein [Streptomyces roseolus]|uniref:hypothetical protein n=1 Tax=Streptomyces roseolus TaxID=67358 RepID=UPI0037A592B0
MSHDPAPQLKGPEDAFERLAEWKQEYERLMLRRDPLVIAALRGPLAGHGGTRHAERASSLTAQTLRRVKAREDIPVLPHDYVDEVDWDEYADYLEIMGTSLRRQLAELPAPASGRPFTADDLRASRLIDLAERLRDTERTDFALWQLTLELRHAAQDRTAVLQEEWTETADAAAMRNARAQLLTEVADQITAFRTEGPAAVGRLDPGILARARAELAPPAGPGYSGRRYTEES